MWDSNLLFYLVVIALVLFILIFVVLLLTAIIAMTIAGKVRSSLERVTTKAEETMEAIQDVAYDAPGWSIAFFDSVIGAFTKPKRRKKSWLEKIISK